VVSPNGNDGPVHKFNYDNSIVFEYASKIPNIDMNHVAITVVSNDENLFFSSGETAMWESGASIAYIDKGGPSNIICHETGGHGIAKLLDEYVYSGYENNHTQEGANEEFRNWIKTAYHDKGWGMNISATDNPDEVPWSHFLKDDRYKNEVGIYQGAWYWPEELWRPSENSVMNRDYSWFNAPSREAIYKMVMQLSEGDEWSYDYEAFVVFDTPIREAYNQERMNGNDSQDIQRRRIELRPPTIYKGSWRDAGSREQIRFGEDKYIPQTDNRAQLSSIPTRSSAYGNDNLQEELTPYIMYRGERISIDQLDRNKLREMNINLR
jgi:hypothetical protein